MTAIPEQVIAVMTYDLDMHEASSSTDFGRMLRLWRGHFRLSQLELASRADMSQRHLSFIETGRARPGADVVLRIADALDIPLRDRNRLLVAAGLAPRFPEVPLDDETAAPFRTAVRRMLTAHEPFPAFALDRWWDVVDANPAARRLFPMIDDAPTNVVDTFLAPGGLRTMVVNFPEVAGMYLRRLQAEVAEASDERLLAMLERARMLLRDVPIAPMAATGDLVVCPKLRFGDEIIGTVTMVARFGSTREVTLDELRVELIFPADEAAESFFRHRVLGVGPSANVSNADGHRIRVSADR